MSRGRAIAFSVILPPRRTRRHAAAYELTVRLLRLHNGAARRRTFASNGFDEALRVASEAGYSALVVVRPGCFVTDIAALIAFMNDGVTGELRVEGSPVLACVDLDRWRHAGRRAFESLSHESLPSSATKSALFANPDDAETYYLVLAQLQEMALAWRDRTWSINYEELTCSEKPPGPVRLFAGVAAGLKPNALLDATGWTSRTHVMYVDSSRATLAFRRWLVETWNGDDYVGAIERWRRLPGQVAAIAPVSESVRRRVDAMEAHFGGRRALRKHWSRYRRLDHSYWHTSLLGDGQQSVLEAVRESAGPRLVWWSNVFHSLYTHVFHDEAQSEALFANWMNGLATIADTFVVGTDPHGGDVTQLMELSRRSS